MPKALDDYGSLAVCTVYAPCERALFAERRSMSSTVEGGLHIAGGKPCRG
ncbi:MAG: hypothetical protein QOJ73_2088 [Streptosporangiaceae bacterium]|jgi:hypothetical protein|nr:hypothetical protein [Streptosporangiaceae bacterium]